MIRHGWLRRSSFTFQKSNYAEVSAKRPERIYIMDEEKIICAECGAIIEDMDDAFETEGGDTICRECYENDYAECYDCGEIHRIDEMTETDDGNFVCDSCFESNYLECVCCNHVIRIETDMWGNQNIFETEDGNVCQRCYDSYYESCNGCGEIHHIDDMEYDEEEEAYYCSACERNRKKKNIKQYGYKPSPIFKTSAHDKFYTSDDIRELVFGVELEVDNGNDPEETAGELLEASEDIYCKQDGSLNNGIEIVTHPCTLSYHMNDLGWPTLCKIAISHGFLSNDARTCGLHVHVGRKQLGSTRDERNATTAKMILLVQRHWDALVKFTRRKERQLDRWAEKPNVDMRAYSEDELIENALMEYERGRYLAVNLQNRETVELRLFNGSLKPNTIIATLQFVSNLCLYAKHRSINDVLTSQWKDICDYHKYDELSTYLVERDLTNVPDLMPNKIFKASTIVDANGTELVPGDIVKILNANGDGVYELGRAIGEYATVICKWKNRDYDMGIQFEDKFRGIFYSLDGRISTDTGLWVHSCNVEFVRHAEDSQL